MLTGYSPLYTGVLWLLSLRARVLQLLLLLIGMRPGRVVEHAGGD